MGGDAKLRCNGAGRIDAHDSGFCTCVYGHARCHGDATAQASEFSIGRQANANPKASRPRLGLPLAQLIIALAHSIQAFHEAAFIPDDARCGFVRKFPFSDHIAAPDFQWIDT